MRSRTATSASLPSGLLPPRNSRPWAIPTRTSRAPVAVVTCSKLKSAAMVCPKTVKRRSSPKTASRSLPGRVSMPMATDPDTETPLTAKASWTARLPVSPVGSRVKVPVVPETWLTVSSGAAGVPPSRRAALRSRSVVVAPVSSSSRSACRLCPATWSVMPVPTIAR